MYIDIHMSVRLEMAINFYIEHSAEFKAKFTTAELASIEYQIGKFELYQPDLEELLK